MTPTYTTYGPVRGTCGHQHKTEDAAQKCVEHDQRACRAVRGYSDRRVILSSDLDAAFQAAHR